MSCVCNFLCMNIVLVLVIKWILKITICFAIQIAVMVVMNITVQPTVPTHASKSKKYQWLICLVMRFKTTLLVLLLCVVRQSFLYESHSVCQKRLFTGAEKRKESDMPVTNSFSVKHTLPEWKFAWQQQIICSWQK